MARKTKEETEKTYYALLDAAAQLFIHQGVAKTTLNQIGEAAGMTRGAVYWHFKNKDAVVLALWQENASSLHDEMKHALEHMSDEHTAQDFRAIMGQVLQQVLEDPRLAQALRIMIHCIEVTEEETELRLQLEAKRNSYYSSILYACKHLQARGCVKVDLPPESLAVGVMSYLYGLVSIHLEPGNRLEVEQDLQALMQVYLNALLHEQGRQAKPISGLGSTKYSFLS